MEGMKELREKFEAAIKASQEACPHTMGSNPIGDSVFTSPASCIVWHTIIPGQDPVGICLNCQKLFRSGEPGYDEARAMRQMLRPSAGGVEQPITKDDLIDKTWLPEDLYRVAYPEVFENESSIKAIQTILRLETLFRDMREDTERSILRIKKEFEAEYKIANEARGVRYL